MSAPTRRSSSYALRSAFTLIEMLVGMAITLVMMAAVVNLFANLGAGVKVRRATMEMSGELRMVRATLFNDLAGATCLALPWREPADDEGYLEIVEGEYEDLNPTGLNLNMRTSQVPGSQDPNAGDLTDTSGLGDYDDILSLTVRNERAPFKGRAGDQSFESPIAEIVWYAVENPEDSSLGEPGMRTVYRRVLLVAPWIEPLNEPNDPVAFFRKYDVSARYDATLSRWVPNSLGDLTKRENRFAHRVNAVGTGTGWPFHIDQRVIRNPPYDPTNPPQNTRGPLQPFGSPFEPTGLTINRQGEDVMLSNVLAWDLRVFDPGAPLYEFGGVIVEPVGTNVFNNALGGNLVGFGAYVDLGWDDDIDYPSGANPPPANSPVPVFQEEHAVGWISTDPNSTIDNSRIRTPPCVYDTWSFHYENDGLDQDNDGLVDEGTNGLDDDGINGVDDLGERETSPPYPVPLRGVQAILRIYEPETRQIREATVTRNFVQP